MGNYYCLVAGLPEIAFDDTKCSFNTASLKEELKDALSKKDYTLIELYFARYDNQNLLALLENSDAEIDGRGNLTSTEILEVIQQVKENETINNKSVPTWFPTFINENLLEDSSKSKVYLENRLATLLQDTMINSSNRFVREWSEFNLNLNNILTAITCRKHDLDMSENIIGDSEISEALCNSMTKDFGIAPLFPWLDEVLRISEENNLHEREMKIDRLRWDYLVESSFFHYFSTEKLFAYLLQLEIMERWLALSKETGLAVFKEFIESLKGSFVFDNAFALPKNFK